MSKWVFTYLKLGSGQINIIKNDMIKIFFCIINTTTNYRNRVKKKCITSKCIFLFDLNLFGMGFNLLLYSFLIIYLFYICKFGFVLHGENVIFIDSVFKVKWQVTQFIRKNKTVCVNFSITKDKKKCEKVGRNV